MRRQWTREGLAKRLSLMARHGDHLTVGERNACAAAAESLAGSGPDLNSDSGGGEMSKEQDRLIYEARRDQSLVRAETRHGTTVEGYVRGVSVDAVEGLEVTVWRESLDDPDAERREVPVKPDSVRLADPDA